MYKIMASAAIIFLLIIIALLLFYEINTYAIGEKYIDENGKIFLIFEDKYYGNTIPLLKGIKIMNIKIKNHFIVEDKMIYEIYSNLFDFDRIIALSDKKILILYLFNIF